MNILRIGQPLSVETRAAIRDSARSSVARYMRIGPAALEKRLEQLEIQIRDKKTKVFKQVDVVAGVLTFGLSIKAKRWLFSELNAGMALSHSVRQRAFRIVVSFSRLALAELRAERDAIRNFLGTSTRVWETKDAGPAPI